MKNRFEGLPMACSLTSAEFRDRLLSDSGLR